MASITSPIVFRWTGEAMEPLPRFHNQVNADFVIGQVYRLVEVEDRSAKSHRHQFAWISEAWANLPDSIADEYPTSEHLRKRALILAGWFVETIIDAGSNAAALRVAAHLRHKDEFAYVAVRGSFVIERVAKSQAHVAMDPKAFAASKQRVLEIISEMIGVAPETLQSHRQAA